MADHKHKIILQCFAVQNAVIQRPFARWKNSLDIVLLHEIGFSFRVLSFDANENVVLY